MTGSRLLAAALASTLALAACHGEDPDHAFGLEEAYAAWEAACQAETDAWEPYATSFYGLEWESNAALGSDVMRSIFRGFAVHGGEVHLVTEAMALAVEQPVEDGGAGYQFLRPEFLDALERLQACLDQGRALRETGTLRALASKREALGRALASIEQKQISGTGRAAAGMRWRPDEALQAVMADVPDVDPAIEPVAARLSDVSGRYRRALEGVADAKEVLEAHALARLGRPVAKGGRIESEAVEEAFVGLAGPSNGLVETTIELGGLRIREEWLCKRVERLESLFGQGRAATGTAPARWVDPMDWFDEDHDDPFEKIRELRKQLRREAGGRDDAPSGTADSYDQDLARARAAWDRESKAVEQALAAVRSAIRLQPLPDREGPWIESRLLLTRGELDAVREAAAAAEASLPGLRDAVLAARADYEQLRRNQMLRHVALLTGRDLSSPSR